ncbi:RagB/SusD family nutrient uptake outer membrane protein [Dysgonomonas sp. ZJ709]|uniref:RagB/SusD family nutrient uptake outer membrane protein n=1 Tax=Dysgonomonas sp. ZJ709 TaxID=2709797 RepID=UPI0013EABECB|nr:RagB/SusD family nutrient uptake outer membrane protein [Dysgonomonas sp. ZJ709]
MRNIKYIISCILLAILSFACEDYLDKQPDDQKTEEEVFTRYTEVNKLVTDLYSRAKVANRPLAWFYHFSSAAITDEAEGTTVEGNITNRFNTGDWSTMSLAGSNGQYWWDIYAFIRRANVILEGVAKYNSPDNPLEPGSLEKRIGEVYFLRGYLHYLLLRSYGEIPYLDHSVDPNSSMDFTKESVHSIVEKIVADAEEGYKRVPGAWGGEHFGRVDKGACLGLIAIARWTAATPLWNGAKEAGYTGERVFENEYTYDQSRWVSARDAAKAVLECQNDGKLRYKLYDTHSETDFNDDAGENKNESTVYARLWDMYYDMTAFQNEAVWFVTKDKYEGWYGDMYPPSRGGSARQQPVQEQVDEYEYISPDGYGYPVYSAKAKADGYDDGNPYKSVKRDPRFYRDIIYHGAPFRDGNNNPAIVDVATGSDKINASNATKTGYYHRKYFRDSWNRSGSVSISAPPIWRLPDFVYIYCEAVNEISGPNEEIYQKVNAVRARSFMAPMPPATKMDKNLMREYIKRERRVEFYYENKRAWDCRLYVEPSNEGELIKEQAWKSAGSTNDERSQKYWATGLRSYPKSQRMINGMRPVEDPNGKIVINGVKYRMERYCVEERVFDVPRHYLFPIMETEIQRSPTLVQNPGWN